MQKSAQFFVLSAMAIASTILTQSTAVAEILTGDSVTATHLSGGWDGIAGGSQALPTGYVTGFLGIPIMNINISDSGAITVTPNGISCGSGCSWNFGGPEVFQFVLDASAPPLIGLDTISSDPNIGVSFALVNSSTFDVDISGSGFGQTNVNVTTGQLDVGSAAPEPATSWLLICAVAALVFFARRPAIRARG